MASTPLQHEPQRSAAVRPATGLRGRDFLLLLAATLGTFSNYAPLLSVAPLWSADGGSGHGGVGAVTAVTMGTTVAVQLCMGRLLRRLSLRQVLVAGALLLGVPTFAYALSSGLGWVLAVSAVRGVGFGMVAVAGSALVAELVPAGQRGRAVGWYGIAVGLPQVVCLPLGLWMAQNVGFTAVFVAAGALSVLAAPLVLAMSGHRATGAGEEPGHEPGEAGRTEPGRTEHTEPDRTEPGRTEPDRRRTTWPRSFAAPFVTLIVTACGLGAVTSFLPLAPTTSQAAPAALFTLTAAVIAGRWGAGVWSDRSGSGRLTLPGTVACAVGLGGLALAAGGTADGALVTTAAAAVFGLGFGALQNDTLVVMFRRAGQHGNGAAGTAWNMAYDAGTGIGAMAVGALSQLLAVNGAFAATAVLIALALPYLWTDHRREAVAQEAK
ncbi:MFS transporter [Streptomyces monticola]|uniref:MFS transporter n=1 Tax=Streptomyces monticola TaxID=2666263 RepID=A0ABW2JUK1_9ACTN